MAEKLPDHRQAFTHADADTCKTMSEIMKAQVLYPCFAADAEPEVPHADKVAPSMTARENITAPLQRDDSSKNIQCGV